MFQALLHGMGELLAYFYSLIPNYGVAIIMLTVLVRTAMIPLAIKQAHSMQANRGNAERIRKLQPEVKKLREKYKDDRQRQYEEQKRLYEENGVNMLGGLNGCLPVLLQMPIFFAMYAVLQGCTSIFGGRNCVPGYHIPKDSPLYTAISERTATFLGTNLELRPQEVFTGSGLGAALPYVALIAVMAGTMWYQTQMMIKLQPAPDPQMAATQKVMKLMPVMLVVFSWNFPAGLILYWSASNAWTIGQQFLLMKKFGGPMPEEDPATSKPGGRSGRADSSRGSSAKTKDQRQESDRAPRTTSGGGTKASSGGPRRSNAKGSPGASSTGRKGATQRPAAKGARAGGSSGGRASGRAPANGRKAEAAEPSGNGSGDAAKRTGGPVAGKPKGSGSRKGNKGGRR